MLHSHELSFIQLPLVKCSAVDTRVTNRIRNISLHLLLVVTINYFIVPETKPRATYKLDKCFTTKLHLFLSFSN